MEKTLVLWEDAEMRWSGILLLSMPRGMEQPGREKQCLSESGPLVEMPPGCSLLQLPSVHFPVPRCSIVGPALLGALVCSVALAGGS